MNTYSLSDLVRPGQVFRAVACLLLAGILGVTQLQAAPGGKRQVGWVTGLPDEKIEVRVDGKYDYMRGTDIADTPAEVLEIDELNFLRIEGKDGKMVWVNKVDVDTDDLDGLQASCHSLSLARAEDTVSLGPRGFIQGCK
jgi:hypothetical protein